MGGHAFKLSSPLVSLSPKTELASMLSGKNRGETRGSGWMRGDTNERYLMLQVIVNPHPLLPWPDAPTLSTSDEAELWDPQLLPDPSESRSTASSSSPYQIIKDSTDTVTSIVLEEERRQSNGQASPGPSSSSSLLLGRNVLSDLSRLSKVNGPTSQLDFPSSLSNEDESDSILQPHAEPPTDRLAFLLDSLEAACSSRASPPQASAVSLNKAAKLLSRIRSASTLTCLAQIVMPTSKRLRSEIELAHVTSAMRRLATISHKVVSINSSIHSDVSQDHNAKLRKHLWTHLVHKASFLLHAADLRSIVDILDSIQAVAALRYTNSSQNLLSLSQVEDKAKSHNATPQDRLIEEGDWQSLNQDQEPGLLSESFDIEPDQPNERSSSLSPSARPLYSGRSLSKDERHLIVLALTTSNSILTQSSISVDSLLRLANAAGRLGISPPGYSWQSSLLSAFTKLLPMMTSGELVSLATAISRLPSLVPSQASQLPPELEAWSSAFYERSMRLIRGCSPRDLTCLLMCASRLPKPRPVPWIEAMLQRILDEGDELDPLAFALTLHSLGRLRLARSLTKVWARELLERSMPHLNKFSSEELSLILRSCAMMRIVPDQEWLTELFSLFHPSRSNEAGSRNAVPRGLDLLRTSSGPQLSNIGWSLALLRVLPPRQWIHEWQQQLRKRIHAGDRPPGIPLNKWHGVGYSLHAKRAAVALRAFEVPCGSSSGGREGSAEADIEVWCKILRTPVPPPLSMRMDKGRGERTPPSGIDEAQIGSDEVLAMLMSLDSDSA